MTDAPQPDGRPSEAEAVRMTEALAYAENIVATVREPLVVLDAGLRVRSANRSFYRTFGVVPEETEGRLVYDLGDGQWDIPALRRLLEEILPQNSAFDDFEVDHEFEGVGRRSMLLNARKVYRPGNHSELILLAIEDVTERRRLEAERHEIEVRFTSLVKNIRDHSIFTLSPDGKVSSWNVEAERILGFSEAEALGLDFPVIFTPEDIGTGEPERELRTARETGRAEDERWHLRKNGERFWAFGIVTPMHDPDGTLVGYSKILRDVTDRKRAEEELRRSEGRLRLLWEAAETLLTADGPDRMLSALFDKVGGHLSADAYLGYVADEAGRLRLASWAGIPDEAAERISTLEPGQAGCGTAADRREPGVGDGGRDSGDPAAAAAEALGFRAYVCHPLVAGDRLVGTLSFASRTKDAFGEDESEFLRTLARYVTLAHERLRLVEELRRADRRKDEFLAMLGHELRNPLAPIRSGLDLLRMERTFDEVVELMSGQVEHLIRLVDDLLDVSRILRGKVELRRRPVELSEVVRRAAEAVRPMFEAEGQGFTVTLPDGPVGLDADPVRLSQVFTNLLTNAGKYTEPGGRIMLTAERDGDEAVVRVTDTGNGIDPDLLPLVFDPFTQSERTLDRSQGGLGLGLALVKSLTEMHGGSVSARSEGEGRGSEFTVRLPVAGAVEAAPEAPEVPEERPPSAGRRILVVDDNVPAEKLLVRLLGKLGGHEVIAAHDGESALAAAEGFRPDLILLDIGLPKLDGYEVARRLRANPEFAGTVLVAVTGYGSEEDRRRSAEAGFDDHMIKPPGVEMLRAVLSHPKLRRP